MMFDLFQFRDCIARPALRGVGLWDESAEVLLLGTCMIESNFGTYLKQVNGPALGIYQMEPVTHSDLWENYLNSRDLSNKILEASLIYISKRKCVKYYPDVGTLIFNLNYATLMARVHYLRVKQKLPAADDAVGLADYYKKYYNTYRGAANVDHCIVVFKDLIVKLRG